MPTDPTNPLSRVEKLCKQHNCELFRCHKNSLQDWLKRYALKNQLLDSSQTYVVHRGGVVVGYYALTCGALLREECPAQISQGMPKYPIPVIILARLAVDDREAGRGLGKALLKDALLRTVSAAEIAGARAVLVHAIDDEAREFYKRFGFEDTPVGPRQLMKSMADIRASLFGRSPD